MEPAFDLEKWLRGAGIKDEKIAAVATVLRAEDVDTPENLVTLTDSALQTLGLTMGQRQNILKAAAEFSTSPAAPLPLSAYTDTPFAQSNSQDAPVFYLDPDQANPRAAVGVGGAPTLRYV